MRCAVWWVVVACVCEASAAPGPGPSCAAVQEFFSLANISAEEPPRDAPPPERAVCGGACCSWRREEALRARVRRDLGALAAHTSRALQGLLLSTRRLLHDHVMELSKQSLNKSHMLFGQVYKGMATHARAPIEDLYSDIRAYIDKNSTGAQADVDLERSTARFFRELFPLVYHKAAKQEWLADFTADYKSCLREAYADVTPFGDIPLQISTALVRSLRSTRALLEALAAAAEVLRASDELLAEEWEGGGACAAALLRMSHCAKCRGLPLRVKPCAGYCLNVLRGCVTWRVAELDAPWNAFVEDVQRLMTTEGGPEGRSATGDAALRPLDSRVSEAIMHAMENGLSLEKKVKHACGHARLVEAPAPAASPPAAASLVRRDQLRVAPPDTHITHFLASVDKSKGFYINLADTLCQDESLAEQAGEPCWDGDNVGQYSKTVVGPGASFQKYNPEVAVPSAADDHRVAALADKLLHVTQLLVAQMPHSANSENLSFMQGDEAGPGAEGSGSGRDDYDADDDNYDAEGSGEGSGAIETTDVKQGVVPHVVEANASGCAAGRASRAALLGLLLLHALRRLLVVL